MGQLGQPVDAYYRRRRLGRRFYDADTDGAAGRADRLETGVDNLFVDYMQTAMGEGFEMETPRNIAPPAPGS